MLSHENLLILGTVFFALAVLHTFCVKFFLKAAHHFPEGSGRSMFFHLLGEVEIVFSFWAAVFFLISALMIGFSPVVEYVESVNFTEPIFVFCIMMIAATRPVLTFAKKLISVASRTLQLTLKLPAVLADLLVVLSLGPLSGSAITEPAAMTVTALLLLQILARPTSRLLYFVLAVLFVNVSIGGALTHFAAPPILMVASKWNWDTTFVFTHFGWKSLIAVVLNSCALVWFFRKNIQQTCQPLQAAHSDEAIPLWVTALHLLFLVGVILSAHHAKFAFGLFLFFLGVTAVTKKYQETLRFRESFLVAFFLGGIVLFGAFQTWWLQPLLSKMNELVLFSASVALTSVTDNAALTYLGAQVQGLSDSSKYYLVAGALAGGGLTIIANAPNAAGFSVLQSKFKDGLNPFQLLLAALLPTVVAVGLLSFI